jgi:hypothetical protein
LWVLTECRTARPRAGAASGGREEVPSAVTA